MNAELLKKYGLPTAIAGALMGLVAWLVRQQTKALEEQLDFLMRLVDAVCTK